MSVRVERQVLLVRRDHRLASRASASLTDLADETLLLHPRDANPGHYDAVLGLCREWGVAPRVLLRTMTFDLGYGPIVDGEAVAIVGSRPLPDCRTICAGSRSTLRPVSRSA